MKLAVLKNWIQNASSSNDNEIILKGLKGMKIHSWRHLPHACFTYSLGFVFTFAGIISPTSKPQHITRSFSLSLSHLHKQISAMRKSLKSEKDVQYVKMSYSSLVIIRECHKRRNVPKRVLKNSNSGNCVLSKDSPSFQQPIHLLKKYLSGAIISALC